MAKFDIKRLISKGLQTDNGYENIPNGTYGYAQNFRDSTLNSESLESVKGTQVAINVPDIAAQNGRMTLTPVKTGRSTLTFYYAGFNVVVDFNVTETQVTASAPTTFSWNYNFWQNVPLVFQNNLTFTYNAVTQGLVITNTLSSDYNDIIIIETSNTNVFEIISEQETLNPDIPGQTGALKPIGSFYGNKNKLYIFSAISETLLGGYGEIGYYDTFNNTYTKLLGSKELNFTTRKQIDVDGETRDGVDYLYFTDNFNPVRCIYSNAPYLSDINYNTIANDILLNQQNASSSFWLGNTGSGVISYFDSFESTTGNLRTGTYRYAFRFKDSNYSPSEWSNISGPFEVKVNEQTTSLGYSLSNKGFRIMGDYTSGYGTHSVNIKLQNINTDNYAFADVMLIYYEGSNSGNFTSGFIYENINIFSSTVNYIHNNESDFQALTSTEVLAYLEDTDAGIDRAKSLRILNNRLLLGNVTKSNYDKFFSNWARTIKIVDCLNAVEGLDIDWDRESPTSAHFHKNIAEYYNPINRAQNMGYMPHEEYRFGIQLKLNNGAWSDSFFIKDHRFDQGADTGPTRKDKPISFEWTDTFSYITMNSATVSAGNSFIKDGFVKGMYIAIQDEFEGQSIEDTKQYLEGSDTMPLPITCNGSSSLGSWYDRGNLIDFRRRLYYGNNGGADYLDTPYFKILRVEDGKITLDPTVGGPGLRHYCGADGSGVYSSGSDAQSYDLRRRVSSVYIPPKSSRWNQLKYHSNHPYYSEGNVFSLNPKFIIDVEQIKPFATGYRIVRAPIIKEVLATGLAVVSESGRDCDAGIGLSNDGDGSFFYPTYGSNTIAQRKFMGDYTEGSTTTSSTDTHISPIFNNRTVNGDLYSDIHIPGDGKTHSFVTEKPGHDIAYAAKDNINRPHPCVLSHGDMEGGETDAGQLDFLETGTTNYKPHFYSGRKFIYFHAPDFDVSTTEGVPGYTEDWKTRSVEDEFINLGRVYFGTQPFGAPNGQAGTYNTGLNTEVGQTNAASQTYSAKLGERKIFSATTGWPYVYNAQIDGGATKQDLPNYAYTGICPDEVPNGESYADIKSHTIKSVDNQVLFCNRIPYVPLYGNGDTTDNATNKFLAQPGLSHVTFKHWSYYNIHDAKHTGTINSAGKNPARADKLAMFNESNDTFVNVYSSISYGSGNLKGEDTNGEDGYNRRVDLANTSSMYNMARMISAHDGTPGTGPLNGSGLETRSNLVCRAPKCMVISLSNKYESPSTDEWGQDDNYSSGTGANATNGSIKANTIGLTDGGGRNLNTATKGLQRVYSSADNVYERNVHHNWAQFADRGQNYNTADTTNTNYGAYGWNKMSDDTGMYMGMYFRKKSKYINNEWSEELSKYGSLGNQKYIQTGHSREISKTSPNVINDVVFGGDVMCQRSYRMISFANQPYEYNPMHPISGWADTNFTANTGSDGYVVDPFTHTSPGYNAEGQQNENNVPIGGTADLWSNIMVAMYSINRINVQTRTALEDTSWQNFAEPRAPFPFSTLLTSALFQRSAYHLFRGLKITGTGLNPLTGEGQIAEMTTKTALPQESSGDLVWGSGGHKHGISLADMTGSDELIIHNSYIIGEGDVGVSYGYNPTSQVTQNLATRIYYSDERNPAAVADFYKNFNLTNFTDLGVALGPINHLEVINGELYAIQPKAFSRLFMKDRAMVKGDESGAAIILGSTDIFSAKEKVLTQYGTSEKWSALKGVTKDGKEVLVWVDESNAKIMRFDERIGVNSISDLFGISETVKHLSSGMDNYQLSNPVGAGGIHGVWDDENSEFVFTWKFAFTPGEEDPEIIEFTSNEDNTYVFLGNVDEEPIDEETDDLLEEFDMNDEDTSFGDGETADDTIDEDPDEDEETGPDDEEIEEGGGLDEDPDVEETDDDADTGGDDDTGTGTTEEQEETFGDDLTGTSNPTNFSEWWQDMTGGIPDLEDVFGGMYDNGPFTDGGGVEEPETTFPPNRFAGQIIYLVANMYLDNAIKGTGVIDTGDKVLQDPVGTQQEVFKSVVNVFDLLYGRKGTLVGNQYTFSQIVSTMVRYLGGLTKDDNGISGGSKDPRPDTSGKLPDRLDIVHTADRMFLDNYVSNTTRSKFRAKIKTTALATNNNTFINKFGLSHPKRFGGILYSYDFSEHRNIISSSTNSLAATDNTIKYVLGNNTNRYLSRPHHSNSKFKQRLKGWSTHSTNTTDKYIDKSDDSLVLSATGGSDKISLYPTIGKTAEGSITFSASPNAGATFKIIDTAGVTKIYKAINQTSAGAIDKTKTGVVDLTDGTIQFERGEDETGTTAQITKAAECLIYAIKSSAAHKGAIKTVQTAGAIALVQRVYGTSGNTTITATGTHNSTVVNFTGGLGKRRDTMPRFITNSVNKIADKSIKPYKQNQIVQIVLDYTINTSTYGSASIKINQSASASGTTDSDGLTITSTNGRNRHVKYLKLAAADPIVTLVVNNCLIKLHHFQVKTVTGNHLTVSSATNMPTYKAIDASHPRQAGKAVTAVASGTPAVLVTDTMNTDVKNDFKNGHTIAMVISSDNATGDSHIFEYVDSSRVYLAIKSSSSSAHGPYYAHSTEGSGSGNIDSTNTKGYFEDISASFNTGYNNIIIATFSGTTYNVYGNGSTTATAITGVDQSSVAAPTFKFGAQNGYSVKEFIVLDKAVTATNRKKLAAYLSWKHNTPCRAGELTNAVISANSYVIPTSYYNAKYKNNAIGDKRSSVGGALYTLYAEAFTDSTPTLSTESTDSNFMVAKAKIKALGFTGGGAGTTNGPDAWTVKITPSGGSISVIDTPKVVKWDVLTSAGTDYELETRFSMTKGTSVTLSINVERTTATGSSEFIYEVTDLHLKKGVKYAIPETLNTKTVLAKVNTPNGIRLFKRNSVTLEGYANSIKLAAKDINPLTATTKWTEISSELVSKGNLEVGRQNIDNISGRDELLRIGRYFTSATLSWSEHRKKFTSFYSFMPELYLKYKNTYLSYDSRYHIGNEISGMTLHSHNVGNYSNFYGIKYKSSIFIPVNEVKEHQKTLYTAVLDGTIDAENSLVGNFRAVNTGGSNYVLLDAAIPTTVRKKDDFYTVTPTNRLHGKAFVIEIASNTTQNNAYIKINGIIAKVRAEAPLRNLLSKQNPFKAMGKTNKKK